ncbi:hypothetical protein [Marinomonas balearica]|uniref:Monosaccharide ABC transporter substrate-binding protein (CUT2 family) n=1 Tax=Marinomonas balearica TaxID=491947 RepID=A0A4R6MBI9_9GAMM|nr:hypothetical protein [Marinomonas balearica]TDO97599.1 monosaccharide ABC transporter substrate-binding protein (CUT2 family) [Marinomonas balearica]
MPQTFYLAKVLFLFCIVLISSVGQCGSLKSYLVTTEDFFDLFPAEKVLSDQFSARIGSPSSSISISQSRPVRIALVLSLPVEDMANGLFIYSLKRRLQELRIDFHLDLIPTERLADFKLNGNVNGIVPDFIVFDQLSPAVLPLIERLLKRRFPKVIFRNLVMPVKSWLNHSPLLYAGVDENKSMERLASYLARQVPDGAMIDALTSSEDAFAKLRCDRFFDELHKRGMNVRHSLHIDNTVAAAKNAADELIRQLSPPYFIFGCTGQLSQGIVEAIKHHSGTLVTTNSWGKGRIEIKWLEQGYTSVIVLPMNDHVAIAVAEAIKNELSFDPVPKIYISRTSLLTQDMDSESAHLMFQQAYPYASSLWSKE